jgi:hypothetical protein
MNRGKSDGISVSTRQLLNQMAKDAGLTPFQVAANVCGSLRHSLVTSLVARFRCGTSTPVCNRKAGRCQPPVITSGESKRQRADFVSVSVRCQAGWGLTLATLASLIIVPASEGGADEGEATGSSPEAEH